MHEKCILQNFDQARMILLKQLEHRCLIGFASLTYRYLANTKKESVRKFRSFNYRELEFKAEMNQRLKDTNLLKSEGSHP